MGVVVVVITSLILTSKYFIFEDSSGISQHRRKIYFHVAVDSTVAPNMPHASTQACDVLGYEARRE